MRSERGSSGFYLYAWDADQSDPTVPFWDSSNTLTSVCKTTTGAVLGVQSCELWILLTSRPSLSLFWRVREGLAWQSSHQFVQRTSWELKQLMIRKIIMNITLLLRFYNWISTYIVALQLLLSPFHRPSMSRPLIKFFSLIALLVYVVLLILP